MATKNNGHKGFGIKVELHKGMYLGKDFQAHKMGFVYDENGDLFPEYYFLYNVSDSLG